MQEGVHEYGQDLDPRAYRKVPSLDELKAASPMVSTPEGALMPAKLAGRVTGWGEDEDRDSEQASKLSGLVKDMDESVARWLASSDATLEEAERIMGLWQDIRKITRREGGK